MLDGLIVRGTERRNWAGRSSGSGGSGGVLRTGLGRGGGGFLA